MESNNEQRKKSLVALFQVCGYETLCALANILICVDVGMKFSSASTMEKVRASGVSSFVPVIQLFVELSSTKSEQVVSGSVVTSLVTMKQCVHQ
eukprot:2151-Heterococcus_DN1.PRE.1